MASFTDIKNEIEARLKDEVGTIFKEGPESVALVYPSPYYTGMSSLGFQTIYREINGVPNRIAHRAFLPDSVEQWKEAKAPLLTYESMKPVNDYPVVAFSLAYEMELAGLIHCLELSNIPVLREERMENDPFILAGGPLTFSNPLPAAPFVDAILMGECEDTIHQALDILFNASSKEDAKKQLAERIPSCFVPEIHGRDMPDVEKARDDKLPAFAAIRTPNTELRNMFLLEAERGCHRGCEYCVMRRTTNGGMRTVSKEKIFELIPEDAERVGLVGAAVSDHPQIIDIIETLSAKGKQVSLSSLRADQLTDRFVGALKGAGAKSLTTASDGASQRLRNQIQRRAHEENLFKVAELVRKHGMKRLKLYMMIGLPTETNEDLDELIEFAVSVSKVIPLSLGISPFVSKRNTPLDGVPFAGIDAVQKKMAYLRKGIKGRVDLRSTSAKWAWVEWVLAQGAEEEGLAVLEAVRKGGKFRDWKRAFDQLPQDRDKRQIIRPGNRLKRSNQLLNII